jgi:hypothetical protein
MSALRLSLLALLAAVVLVGCSWFSRTFDFSFPAVGDIAALPVVVHDQSGIIVSVDDGPPVPERPIPAGIGTVDRNPNALVVFWTGGACDESVAITVSAPPNLDFMITTNRKPGGCDAIGIGRSLLIRLSEPLDMSRTSVSFDD